MPYDIALFQKFLILINFKRQRIPNATNNKTNSRNLLYNPKWLFRD